MTFVCPDPRANQALVLHPTLGTTYVPNSTTLYKIGACLGPEAEEGGYKAQVVFRSGDGGKLWRTVSTILPWNSNGTRFNGEYGPLNYRTAARTLFLRPYLAHFARFFANGRGKSGRRRPILGG